MCLNRVYIRNPKIEPTGLDKPAISVDCGKCSECRKAKSNDWFVRAWYEFNSGHDQKISFLVTLDFDDNHLPLYKVGKGILPFGVRNFDISNLPADVVPCFDNQEVQSFLSRLRYYVPQFKYLCVAEYGAFLRRPHYHIWFIFNKFDCPAQPFLLYAVGKCWKCGQHFDVSLHDSVGNDPLKQIKYIVGYTTKDITFELDKLDSELPNRYRPRIMNSGHFGEEPLLDGRINYDVLKNCGFVVIDGIKYKIPRYYEQKITYDYHWDKENKKVIRPLNELGKDLLVFRHNGKYVYYVKSFFASRFENIHLDSETMRIFSELYPESPYINMKWRDIVFDVMSDFDIFCNYCMIKDFVFTEKTKPQKFFDSVSKYRKYRPLKFGQPGDFSYKYRPFTDSDDCSIASFYDDFDLPMQATFLYDLYNIRCKEREKVFRDWQNVEQAKKRCWNKLKHNPRLCRYLHAKNYKFEKLYFTRYSDYLELLKCS